MKDILYAAYEGYRANLANFYSPCATDFPRMDFTDYIRDHLIGHFPPAMDAYQFVKLLSKPFQKPPEGLRRLFLATLRCWMSMGPSWRIMLVTSWQTSFSHGSYPVTVKTTARPPHIAANWKITWDIFPYRNHSSPWNKLEFSRNRLSFSQRNELPQDSGQRNMEPPDLPFRCPAEYPAYFRRGNHCRRFPEGRTRMPGSGPLLLVEA